MSSDTQIFERWYLILSLVTFFAMAISCIAFARLSMARIEKDIKREGLPRPASWDRAGYRIFFYATVIASRKGSFWDWDSTDDIFIDTQTVRRLAMPFDRTLARIYLFNSLVWVLVMFWDIGIRVTD